MHILQGNREVTMKLLHNKILRYALTVVLSATVLILSLPYAFAFEKPLKTEAAKASEVTGTFTLILYGGGYSDDLETIAFLDYEGDQYTFEPFAPDFDFRIIKGVPAQEALKRAEKFVNFHNSFWRTQLSKITDHKGNIVGYEVRPLYLPTTYAVSDVLDVHYWLKEKGKVKITIRLVPELEKMKIPGGDAGAGGGH